MREITGRLIILLLSASLFGCSTMQAVPDWQTPASAAGAQPQQGLRAGDRILVTTRDSGRVELLFVALEAEVLVGTPPQGSDLVRIPFDQVTGVERYTPKDDSSRAGFGLALLIALVFLIGIGLSNIGGAYFPPGP